MSEAVKSLLAEDTDMDSPVGLVDLELTPSDEKRVRRAVYMGYGSFHILLSLIPQKYLKVANILGFQGDRRFGLECWQYRNVISCSLDNVHKPENGGLIGEREVANSFSHFRYAFEYDFQAFRIPSPPLM